MCGIVGVYNNSTNIDIASFEAILNTIKHRGPDDYGIYENKVEKILLGHRRLSILDLSPSGKQPMESLSGKTIITFNGEIYNYKEIRDELKKLGHKFRSNSDTEVILASYEEWGIDAIHKFRGMFSFAIYDRKEKKLFLVRDRVGVKPLYYTFNHGTCYFASEIRSLIEFPGIDKTVNLDALSHYLKYGYISSPDSIYENIFVVKPGHYIEIDQAGSYNEAKYWDIQQFYIEGIRQEASGYWDKRSIEEVEEELESILDEAFRYRLVSDVPVGLFLSGGIDSSLLAAILIKKNNNNLQTFTVGYDDVLFNEAPFASDIANHLGSQHHEIMFKPEYSFEQIKKITEIYDEPFGDNSGLSTHLVSSFARDKVKVALSADGGDELFCGYSRYNVVNRYYNFIQATPHYLRNFVCYFLDLAPVGGLEKLYNYARFGRQKRSALREKIIKFKRMLEHNSADEIYEAATSYWYGEELNKLFDAHQQKIGSYKLAVFDEMGGADIITKMMCQDFNKYMVDDILVKVDRASMSVGLEAREPFVDHVLAEYAARLPMKFKYNSGQNKYILKKILYKYLPQKMFERPKQGFSVPIEQWLKGPLKEHVLQLISNKSNSTSLSLNMNAVNKAVNDFYFNNRGSAINVWHLVELYLWEERWLKG